MSTQTSPHAGRRRAGGLARAGVLAAVVLAVGALAARQVRRTVPPPAPATPPAPAAASLLDHVPESGGLTRSSWRSLPVLTKPVTLANDPAPGFVALRVPASGASFVTALGVNPERWQGLASGPFRFTVAVLTGHGTGPDDRGTRKLVLEETIDPAHEADDRRWFPVDVDLDAFAGQQVLLVLTVVATSLGDAPSDLAGWADPRLVERPAGATPAARRAMPAASPPRREAAGTP